MTTNKPEVLGFFVEWSCNNEEGEFKLSLDHFTTRDDYCSIFGGDCRLVPVIRLSDYEALQAECEKLREHLQNLIDQTTPLEPVPGNPMWSRRIQLDEVIAERDSLRAECEKLRKLVTECADYLDTNDMTSIGHGSVLHRRLLDAAMRGGG